ncbi:hypothetical protein CDAR_473981 [Caerostris darwini]|nr:hypothetical protein CDAR_473981 [Caerostris darwini]
MTGSPDRSRGSRTSHHPPTEGKVKAKAAFAEEHPFHFQEQTSTRLSFHIFNLCMRLLSLSYLSIGRNGIVVFILFFFSANLSPTVVVCYNSCLLRRFIVIMIMNAGVPLQ